MDYLQAIFPIGEVNLGTESLSQVVVVDREFHLFAEINTPDHTMKMDYQVPFRWRRCVKNSGAMEPRRELMWQVRHCVQGSLLGAEKEYAGQLWILQWSGWAALQCQRPCRQRLAGNQ